MPNLEFSVPYNGKPEILDEIFSLKDLGGNKIREIYLSGPQQFSGSGRIMPDQTFDEFANTVNKIHNQGIRVNLIMNSTCEGVDWYSTEVVEAKMEYLKKIHEGLGVETVTIANPLYIQEVRERFPKLEICGSVLSDIDCVQRAAIFKKMGANCITPDVSINRDLPMLEQIKMETGLELKLMLNEGCLYKCPFRKFHFNATSHWSMEEMDPVSRGAPKAKAVSMGLASGGFLSTCSKITRQDLSQVFKSGWIRPEDTVKYSQITSYFKIVGRRQPSSMVLRCIKAYMTENWDGDLFDLMCANLGRFSFEYAAYLDNKSLDRYRFFEKITSCDRNCSHCQYCNELAGKVIKLDYLSQEKLEDLNWIQAHEASK